MVSSNEEINNDYPNGWCSGIQSRLLKLNEVKAINVFEKDLIAFRGASGKAYVLDAYCPHLGAHLAVGGTVVGDHIRCPFHGWKFDGTGVCTEVPGLDRILFIIHYYLDFSFVFSHIRHSFTRSGNQSLEEFGN